MPPTGILLSFYCQHFASCLPASLPTHFHLNSAFNPSAVLLHFFTGSQCISLISYVFYHLVVNASRLPPAYFRLRMYSNEYNENVGVKNECQLILAQRNLDAMVQQDRKMLGKQRASPNSYVYQTEHLYTVYVPTIARVLTEHKFNDSNRTHISV